MSCTGKGVLTARIDGDLPPNSDTDNLSGTKVSKVCVLFSSVNQCYCSRTFHCSHDMSEVIK